MPQFEDSCEHSSKKPTLCLLIVLLLHLPLSTAVVVPNSSCYVINNNSHIIDFTEWIGHTFEYNGEDNDFVIRFCKDVESRSQAGYVDFGRYSSFDYYEGSLDSVHFVQKYYGGDLAKCEYTFDKMGRNTQVNIICGNCLHGTCKGELGCICDVTYDQQKCRAFVELAIPCKKVGSRVFEGFTVGFHPRAWEVVYNGLTQHGFEEANQEYRFETHQTRVSLYLTAISTLSGLVGKPTFTVNPAKGLDVKLSGSAANGYQPTTLSPSILDIDWICENAHNNLYEVAISIPIQGYDPVEFRFSKMCEYEQENEGGAGNGWATFGVVSCIFIVLSSLFCCGGFIYKNNVEQQHGLDALPGISILSACLEAVSLPQGYRRQDEVNTAFVNQARGFGEQEESNGAFGSRVQASWEQTPVSTTQGAQRYNAGAYGSI